MVSTELDRLCGAALTPPRAVATSIVVLLNCKDITVDFGSSAKQMNHADAVVLLSAARDLDAIGFYCPKVTGLLLEAAEILRAGARSLASLEALDEIEVELERKAHPDAKPSVGPEFQDDTWLDGLECKDAVRLPVAADEWIKTYADKKARRTTR